MCKYTSAVIWADKRYLIGREKISDRDFGRGEGIDPSLHVRSSPCLGRLPASMRLRMRGCTSGTPAGTSDPDGERGELVYMYLQFVYTFCSGDQAWWRTGDRPTLQHVIRPSD